MGNVFAAEKTGSTPVPGSPPMMGMPVPPISPAAAAALAAANKAGNDLPNPGNFEDLFKKVKEIFPTPLEGCKLVVNKGLSNHFQVSHTLSLSAFNPSSYHFGSTYVGSKQISPTEAFPVLLGDIDTSGSLNAQIIHQLADRIRSKFVVQTQQTKWGVYQAELEYKGPSYTGTLTMANVDPLEGSGIAVLHYMQSITKRLALGAELLYHCGQGQQATVVSLAGKYATDNWIASSTVGPTAFHAAYYHKGKEVQIGVEFESNLRGRESSVSLGYQVDLPAANVVFKGMVDTNWTVAAVLEKRLQPMPFSFILSGVINQWKNQCRFGFGLMIG
ncbi:mitochondrial import receptor subunit TOM40 homolog isoform X1 [Lytechinus pictus]|uniref:mitochondrial import receptor subunit TOM40 homolog isoform X1 n=1 Tax=Lytechinus pictus TaxID=7653 RepID=UPI0030B9E4EF